MLEERYYAIDIFSNEWWINNSITAIIIIILFKVAMMYKRSEKVKNFNYFLGSLLLLLLLIYGVRLVSAKPPLSPFFLFSWAGYAGYTGSGYYG